MHRRARLVAAAFLTIGSLLLGDYALLPADAVTNRSPLEPTVEDLLEARPKEMIEVEKIILNGGYPPEEPWISGVMASRSARGLDTSREEAVALLTSERAQEQYRKYGLLITPEEEEYFIADSNYHEDLSRISPELSKIQGIGELQTNTRARPWSVTVWAHREADVESISRQVAALSQTVDGLTFDVEISKLDPKDVEGARLVWRGFSRASDIFDDPAAVAAVESQGAPTEMVADYINGRVLLGYDPILGAEHGGVYETKTGLRVEIYHEHDVDDADPICGRAYCGSPRSGSLVQRSGGYRCSLGPVIRLNRFSPASSGRAYMTTAGHCGDPSTGFASYATVRQKFSNSSVSSFFEWGTPASHSYPDMSGEFATELANTLDHGGSWSSADALIFAENRPFSLGLITNEFGPSIRQAGWTVTSVGPTVCLAGFKKHDCGTITHTNVTRIVNSAGWIREVRELARATYTGLSGDSGGVIYGGGGYVYGLHQGGSSGDERFSKVNKAVPSNYYGFQIYTVDNGRSHYIANLYWRVLNREPDTSGFDYWSSVLHPSSLDPCSPAKAAVVADSFLLSTEFKSKVPLSASTALNSRISIRVRMAYRTALGREPDPTGLAYWSNHIAAGTTAAAREARWVVVFQSIAASPEFSIRVLTGGASTEGSVCN